MYEDTVKYFHFSFLYFHRITFTPRIIYYCSLTHSYGQFCGHAWMCFDAAVVVQYESQYLNICSLDHLLEMAMMSCFFFFFNNAHPPIFAGEDAEAVKATSQPVVGEHPPFTLNLQGFIVCASSWITLTLSFGSLTQFSRLPSEFFRGQHPEESVSSSAPGSSNPSPAGISQSQPVFLLTPVSQLGQWSFCRRRGRGVYWIN